MKKISLILSFLFLSIGLFGCQQSSGSENNNDTITKQNEVTENEVTNENYDIVGVVTEVNNERNRVLLNLTKKVQEDEKQMWVTVGENTKISNEKEETVSFGNLNPEVKLKVNLTGMCEEPRIRICSAEEIVISTEKVDKAPSNTESIENEKEYMESRQVAWDSLSENTKDTVIGDWQKAEVIEVSPDDVPQHIKLEKNQKVVKVLFHTKQDELLGPIGLYIDHSSKEIIGRDPRK
ncbi:hypothetical protein ACIQD3_24430 [Peribacillus loiseleuriae]|uniref:hypothetical protein n=1 Tax=Peribacillus loiseleuriae TaxID=1679170 RepID=UPI003804C275